VRGSFVNQPKTRVKATISGKSYTIIGRKSQQEMQSIVRVLQEQLDQITRVSDKLSTEEVALLAAINAISNQFEKQEEVVALKKRVEQLEKELRSVQHKRPSIDANRKQELEKLQNEIDNNLGTNNFNNTAHDNTKKEYKIDIKAFV